MSKKLIPKSVANRVLKKIEEIGDIEIMPTYNPEDEEGFIKNLNDLVSAKDETNLELAKMLIESLNLPQYRLSTEVRKSLMRFWKKNFVRELREVHEYIVSLSSILTSGKYLVSKHDACLYPIMYSEKTKKAFDWFIYHSVNFVSILNPRMPANSVTFKEQYQHYSEKEPTKKDAISRLSSMYKSGQIDESYFLLLCKKAEQGKICFSNYGKYDKRLRASIYNKEGKMKEVYLPKTKINILYVDADKTFVSNERKRRKDKKIDVFLSGFGNKIELKSIDVYYKD